MILLPLDYQCSRFRAIGKVAEQTPSVATSYQTGEAFSKSVSMNSKTEEAPSLTTALFEPDSPRAGNRPTSKPIKSKANRIAVARA
jgi:hypothetical protein